MSFKVAQLDALAKKVSARIHAKAIECFLTDEAPATQGVAPRDLLVKLESAVYQIDMLKQLLVHFMAKPSQFNAFAYYNTLQDVDRQEANIFRVAPVIRRSLVEKACAASFSKALSAPFECEASLLADADVHLADLEELLVAQVEDGVEPNSNAGRYGLRSLTRSFHAPDLARLQKNIMGDEFRQVCGKACSQTEVLDVYNSTECGFMRRYVNLASRVALGDVEQVFRFCARSRGCQLERRVALGLESGPPGSFAMRPRVCGAFTAAPCQISDSHRDASRQLQGEGRADG